MLDVIITILLYFNFFVYSLQLYGAMIAKEPTAIAKVTGYGEKMLMHIYVKSLILNTSNLLYQS